ncbi:MAG: IMP dehydrogenase [Candidatus Heimdallarchaeota archaeon]|nr:IMP dehydrogenase [Candidatus Heimdallarchaeota archaeon]
MTSIETGLTFDDVLLVPRYSEVSSRKHVNTTTKLTRNISMHIPVVSSNMDTVTEAEMAIAMARNGGIGIIHRFMSIEEQVRQVSRVKRSMSILIENPYTLLPYNTLGEAQQLLTEKSVSSLMITDEQNKLKGILTKRDMLFEDDMSIRLDTLMTRELITAKPGISSEEAKDILKKNKIEKLPLVDDKGYLKGLISTQDIEKQRKYPNATLDEKGKLRVGAAIGVKDDYLDRTDALLGAGADTIVIDIAHGHSNLVIDTIKKIRKQYDDVVELIAGNVATAEGTEALISHGVDAVKVGVGPGSICITRMVAGSGVPQLHAIMESAKVAHDENIPIIADGGIRRSGDIAKAIAAGASTVMLGNLLAGTTESPGVPITRNGRRVKVIRGMASLGASLGRESRTTGKSFDDEFAQDYTPEGVEAVVPFRGSVKDVLSQLVGGLRSGMSYTGAKSIEEMWSLSKFIRITNSGLQESKSHDVNTV